MDKPTYRKIQYFLTCITVFVLFASFYFQYVAGLHPCPLCLMQRICVFLLLGLLGLTLATQRKAHLVSFMQILISCAGLFFSVRQLWILSLPADKVPVCMPGLDVLMRYFPWETVARALFWGSGECADTTWHMLGIPMPGWSALYFLLMAVTGVILYRNTRTSWKK